MRKRLDVRLLFGCFGLFLEASQGVAAVPQATSRTSPPTSRPAAPAATSASGASLPDILRRIESPATPADRDQALIELSRLGLAGKPALPRLCKILSNGEKTARSTLGRDVAFIIGRMGPEAATAAVAAAKADLIANPPASVYDSPWVPALSELGPNAFAPLADATSDSNESLGLIATRVLIQRLEHWKSDAKVAGAAAGLGPKLGQAWRRADAAPPTPPVAAPLAPAGKKPPATRKSELYELAVLAGPKAEAALASVAEAAEKQRRPNPAAATAAVRDSVMPKPPTPGNIPGAVDALAESKMMALGPAAIVPLIETYLAEPQSRPSVIYRLRNLLSASTYSPPQSADARRRLIVGETPAVLPLDAKNSAALAKIVPDLTKLLDGIDADGKKQPEASARTVLLSIAADQPAATDALLDRLDRLPEPLVYVLTDRLSRSVNPKVLQKVQSLAAAGDARAVRMADRIRLRKLPPKEAAAEIVAKVPADERADFVSRLGDDPETVTLLVELLGDRPSNSGRQLNAMGAKSLGALAAALDRPEPQIRLGALNALPEIGLTPELLAKLATFLGDAQMSDAAWKRIVFAGPTALPLLEQQAKAASPEARVRAAEALGRLGQQKDVPAAATARAAEAVIRLLDDPERVVRSSAWQAAGWLERDTLAFLATRLKSSTRDQRQAMAEAVASSPTTQSEPRFVADVVIRAAQDRRLTDRPNPADSPAVLLGSLAVHKDAEVASVAEEILLRAELAEVAWRAAQGRPLAEGSGSRFDAKIRINALSDDESERAWAAGRLGSVIKPADRPTEPQLTQPYALLLRLLEDPSATVRQKAIVSLTAYVRDKYAEAPANAKAAELLKQPQELSPEAKKALLQVVPLLLDTGVKGLENSADEEVKLVASLCVEQPIMSPALGDYRVPVPLAIAGLNYPVKAIRQKAARTLAYADPKDPGRVQAGVRALLTVALDPSSPGVNDALDQLVPDYCGPHIGPGYTVWKKGPGGEIGKLPTGYEVYVAKIMKRTREGSTADRVKAINEIGAGGPELVAARWVEFKELLNAPDAEVAAAAHSVAATQVAAAVKEKLKISVQPPTPAFKP